MSNISQKSETQERTTIAELVKVITNIDEDDGYLIYNKAKAFDEITDILRVHFLHRLSEKPKRLLP